MDVHTRSLLVIYCPDHDLGHGPRASGQRCQSMIHRFVRLLLLDSSVLHRPLFSHSILLFYINLYLPGFIIRLLYSRFFCYVLPGFIIRLLYSRFFCYVFLISCSTGLFFIHIFSPYHRVYGTHGIHLYGSLLVSSIYISLPLTIGFMGYTFTDPPLSLLYIYIYIYISLCLLT